MIQNDIFYFDPILYSISLLTNSLSLPYFNLESSINALARFGSHFSRYGFIGIIEKGTEG
jgi:hypothetical protein